MADILCYILCMRNKIVSFWVFGTDQIIEKELKSSILLCNSRVDGFKSFLLIRWKWYERFQFQIYYQTTNINISAYQPFGNTIRFEFRSDLFKKSQNGLIKYTDFKVFLIGEHGVSFWSWNIIFAAISIHAFSSVCFGHFPQLGFLKMLSSIYWCN